MKRQFRYFEQDCIIEREADAFARLVTEEGCLIWSFRHEWTDAQIMDALRFANSLYSEGARHGRADKAAEIRGVLHEGADHAV